MSSIRIGQDQRTFIIQMKSSFYAMQALADGRLMHIGSGPLPTHASAVPLSFDYLDQYGNMDYAFDFQYARYELPTFGDVSFHDVALKASFPKLAGELRKEDAPNLPVRDLRLRYVGHKIVTDAAPALVADHAHPPRKSGVARETLVIHLKDAAYDFHARLFYRVTPEYDVIERWLEVENRTGMPVDVETMAFGTVNFPEGNYMLKRAAGAWAREFVTVDQDIMQGQTVLSHLGINTGHEVNPFYLVYPKNKATENGGPVWFGALAYSGNWSFRFDALISSATRVHGGYETTDFGLTLEPGEKHTTPAFVHGVCGDGFGGVSRRMHAFARDYILPGYSAERPVLYNSWEATYFDLSTEGQAKLARAAAAMGVELFCMDDGWFGARRNDRAGLGDWVVCKDIFPQGLEPLISEVTKLGMRFGLWVEPEMINPDSDLYRAHPEWVLHFPGRPRTEGRNQLILDFGRKEVVEFIFNILNNLVNTYDITFFKWDMNRYASEPGSPAGKQIWRKHVEGVYSVMDRLRKAHPTLDIQSCSGGGGRIDLGILQRCDQAWTSDNTDAYDRTFIEDGFSLVYPLRAMESWVTHEHNHQTGRHATTDLRFDVAMRGTLGIGSNIDKLSAEEFEAYKRKIAFYKKIRPVVQNGELYRLATVQDGKVSVWEIVSEDKKRAVYSLVVINDFMGRFLPPYPLKGLKADATYRVEDEFGADLGHFTGGQLMTLGLPGDNKRNGSAGSSRSRTLLLEIM